MPIYSNDLEQAIFALENITSQDYFNTEIIIINDNSSLEVSDYLNNTNLKNVTVINNKSNIGIVKSTNLGIELAKGELIAIFHDDDVYFSNRVSTMVNKYKSNKFDIAGSNFITKSDNKVHRLPSEDCLIRISLFFKCPFLNPSIVFSKNAIKEFKIEYPNNAPVEDYLLWINLSQNHNISLHNVPQTLLKYNDRESRMNISSGGKLLFRREKLIYAMSRLFTINGIDHIDEEIEMHVDFFNGFRKFSKRELVDLKLILDKISEKYIGTNNQKKFNDISRYYFSKGILMQFNFHVFSFSTILKLLINFSWFGLQIIFLKIKMTVFNEIW